MNDCRWKLTRKIAFKQVKVNCLCVPEILMELYEIRVILDFHSYNLERKTFYFRKSRLSCSLVLPCTAVSTFTGTLLKMCRKPY